MVDSTRDIKLARTLAPLADRGTVAVYAGASPGHVADTGERLVAQNHIRDEHGTPQTLPEGRFVCVMDVLGEWHVISAEC